MLFCRKTFYLCFVCHLDEMVGRPGETWETKWLLYSPSSCMRHCYFYGVTQFIFAPLEVNSSLYHEYHLRVKWILAVLAVAYIGDWSETNSCGVPCRSWVFQMSILFWVLGFPLWSSFLSAYIIYSLVFIMVDLRSLLFGRFLLNLLANPFETVINLVSAHPLFSQGCDSVKGTCDHGSVYISIGHICILWSVNTVQMGVL